VTRLSDIGGVLIGLAAASAIAGLIGWRVLSPPQGPAPPPSPSPSAENLHPPGCAAAAWGAAARANRTTLFNLQWSPFGRPETGWATYAPLVAQEVGARCPADSEGFARAYARWQATRKLAADGVFKPADFDQIRDALALRRPFVQQTARGLCPTAPDPATLATARDDEGYGGKRVQLRPAALEAYRRMVAQARREGVATRPDSLRLISGYRGPGEEAARCADGGCNTLTRARCSAHRTGLAIDLGLPPAPGYATTSTADENRRHMAGTAEYLWLVANAPRFGFLPYAYEPWHWEWTGEAP